ncbi:Panacea domain-containing protein [Oceanobacillus kimchii]|uniref:Panacea domain-containing protein n=1 Tax=Oceanobacillus kimchii TaxID=746691 RepID=UPI000984D5FC|nr:type II toxin-antitoxin system antitoxin SocA domain-containing protein [Oceanobacillus kimchii]
MANVRYVAEYFLSLSEERTPLAITPLKLQKLLYYAQAFSLRDRDGALFSEAIEAWKHGPVVPKIYRLYKNYGYFTIPHQDFINEDPFTGETKLNDDEIETINEVWEQFGHLDGKFLEELTHQEDPWLFADINDEIEIEDILEYFTN